MIGGFEDARSSNSRCGQNLRLLVGKARIGSDLWCLKRTQDLTLILWP